MYLSELKVWNFRKYGSGIDDKGNVLPGLSLKLNAGFNLLVGENDTGKSAIIDAIKLVLLTQSYESIRLEEEDFHLPNGQPESNRAMEIRIECIFRGFCNEEAKNFIEWMGFEKTSSDCYSYFLRLTLKAQREQGKIYSDVKAGPDDDGSFMDSKARDLLRVTYLKPLRDAESELNPRRNSRLSQILDSHSAFTDKESHHLVTLIQKANEEIVNYFTGSDNSGNALSDQNGKGLLEDINTYLKEFSDKKNPLQSEFEISEMKLRAILEKLSLNLSENKAGLGSHNLLFIATEMLLLKRENFTGLSLALIEEIEAHLHPQAQLRLVDYLQKECCTHEIQLIMTTHSPNLASKVDLQNLIIIKNGLAYAMGSDYTQLYEGDYLFLQRFLDSTKANLFFAQGVILVEGDAENILIPVIADIIDCPLSHFGVSIVNVGSTAFLRYSRIFLRKDSMLMDIPVACITDVDVRPDERVIIDKDAASIEAYNNEVCQERQRKSALYDKQNVKTFVSPQWTLEYCIAQSDLADDFYKAVMQAKVIQSADKNGWDSEKVKERIDNIDLSALESWRSEGFDKETIAYKIYKEIIINETNKVSKAIIAQCFAKILTERSNTCKDIIKQTIQADDKLEYLVKAIKYACGDKDGVL